MDFRAGTRYIIYTLTYIKIDPITMKIGPIGKTILCLGFRNVKDGSPFIFPFPDIGNNVFPHHWFSSSGMLTEHMYVNRHASD